MLSDIPNNTACFVDANIFYYCLVNTPDLTSDCVGFMRRVEQGDLNALTSSVAVVEAVHKVMLTEATQKHSLSRQGLAHRLQRQGHLISTLTEHKKVAELVRGLKIHVEPLTLDLLERATDRSIKHQLLTNDALTLAVMEKLRLTNIATNDEDFDSVAHLTVWKPG